MLFYDKLGINKIKLKLPNEAPYCLEKFKQRMGIGKKEIKIRKKVSY
jgi:hypothetical protein